MADILSAQLEITVWESGDEDMRYERYDEAREKFLSGIDHTDVNVKSAYLSGLIFWELWHSNNETADSLFVIGDFLYPQLTDDDIINRYLAVKIKSLQYRAKSNTALEQAYALKKKLDNQPVSRLTVSNTLAIAVLYEKLNRPDSLKFYAEQVLTQAKQVIDSSDITMSGVYRIAGIASMRNNEYEQSEERFNKALSIAESALGKKCKSYTAAYGNLPVLYSAQRDYKKAAEIGVKAAALSGGIGDTEGQSIFLTNVGIEYYYLGDFGKSIYYLQQGRALKVELYGEDDNRVTGNNRILGILYEVTGDYNLANEYFQSVLKSYQSSDDVESYRLVEIYSSLSSFNMKINDYEKAKEYSIKAIDLIKSDQGDDHHDLYYNYLRLSTILIHLRETEESLRIGKLANKIESDNKGEDTTPYALSNSNVAVSYAYLGRIEEAVKETDRSLDVLGTERGKMIMSTDGVYILDNRARVFNLQAKRDPSEENITDYIRELKRLINYTDDFRINFSDAFSKSGHLVLANQIYKVIIEDVYGLYSVKKDPRLLEIGLELMEGVKAANLKDVINENVVKFSGLPDSLKTKETELKDAYISLNYSYNEDLQNDSIYGALQAARLMYNDFVEDHVLKDPKYFAMRSDSIKLSIAEVQANLKDQEVVVEYFKEYSHYYALKIGKGETDFYKLGEVGKVDSLVDVWQQLMINRDDAIIDIAQELYNIIWAPLKIEEGVGNIKVVPSGSLWLLSLEALHNGRDYLIFDYNIQYSLSLEVDKFVQQYRKEKNESLAIFAPGWEDDLKNSYRAQVSDSSLLDQEYLSILRQPWSLQLSKYLKDNFDIISYDQEQATESNFKSHLGHTSVLHFASHAVVNNEDPLRSKVHLAKDGDGSSGDDGYLHAYEIFDMSLNADLAVLGACETGVGQMKEGEGMLSLSYAMQYAGCASTIMSLWKIDESSSTAIFSNFYKSLSEEASISEALHSSKLEFIRDEENINFQHPYYWAGTLFMGLDHTVLLQPNPFNYMLLFVGLTLVVLIVIGVKRYTK